MEWHGRVSSMRAEVQKKGSKKREADENLLKHSSG